VSRLHFTGRSISNVIVERRQCGNISSLRIVHLRASSTRNRTDGFLDRVQAISQSKRYLVRVRLERFDISLIGFGSFFSYGFLPPASRGLQTDVSKNAARIGSIGIPIARHPSRIPLISFTNDVRNSGRGTDSIVFRTPINKTRRYQSAAISARYTLRALTSFVIDTFRYADTLHFPR
jgi:hypothetical protein